MFRKIALVCIVLVAVCNLAFAKSDPYLEDAEAEWGSIDSPASIWSWEAAVAHVGRLGEYGDVDAFTVDFPNPTTGWEFQLIVPICGDHFKAFFPSVAVIGSGLGAPEADALPFDLPGGMGVLVFDDNTYKQTYLESGERQVTAENMVTGRPAYSGTRHTIDSPEAGQYTIALFEPDGNVGAFMLSTGNNHDKFADRPEKELESAFNRLIIGDWMGQDCKAPLAAASCPATVGPAGDAQIPDGPVRADVGDGFVLTGIVRDSATCLPLADAQIAFRMANDEGVYDGMGEGVLYTNAQGRYRLESNVPGQYENVTPHIHLAVSAPGYGMSVTEFLFEEEGIESGTVDVNLRPES